MESPYVFRFVIPARGDYCASTVMLVACGVCMPCFACREEKTRRFTCAPELSRRFTHGASLPRKFEEQGCSRKSEQAALQNRRRKAGKDLLDKLERRHVR